MDQYTCFICQEPAFLPTKPVQWKEEDVWACQSCWARIGRWAVRFGQRPSVGFFSEEPLSEEAIAQGLEIARLHGLLKEGDGGEKTDPYSP